MKKIPLTTWYVLLYLSYFYFFNEERLDFTLPLPKEGEVIITIQILYIIVAAVMMGFEIAKAIKFSPTQNNADAFLSIGVAGGFAVMFFFFSFWQHELFFVFTVFAIIDAVVGLLAILGISRRDFDVS